MTWFTASTIISCVAHFCTTWLFRLVMPRLELPLCVHARMCCVCTVIWLLSFFPSAGHFLPTSSVWWHCERRHQLYQFWEMCIVNECIGALCYQSSEASSSSTEQSHQPHQHLWLSHQSWVYVCVCVRLAFIRIDDNDYEDDALTPGQLSPTCPLLTAHCSSALLFNRSQAPSRQLLWWVLLYHCFN